MVLAKSEYDSDGDLAYKEVTNLYRNQRDDIIKLYVGEQVIETTDNHPFWVEGKGWVFADELQVGDKLQKADGSNLTIDKVEFIKLEEPVTVYNFTVADYHTYYVTNLGIWVHNTKCLDSVPSVKNGEFNKWFNSLTTDEFDEVWADPKLREAIKDRLRHPGGMHEWHLVSRADIFKRWKITAEQIAAMRTLISETKFVNPAGKHGGKGSTKAHNELLEIIDTSRDYGMFKRRLQNWADYRLEGGSSALPRGLRP